MRRSKTKRTTRPGRLPSAEPYAGALRRLDAWLDGRELHDVTQAAYLAELHDAGRASSSASMAVAAACFRTKLAGQPSPAGERTTRVLAGYRRTRRALRTLLAATSPEPGDRVVPLSAQMVGLRFTAAAQAAGVESRVDRALGTGRTGVGADESRRVDRRRDARRELEDQPHGGALFCRSDRGTRCCRTVPLRVLPCPWAA